MSWKRPEASALNPPGLGGTSTWRTRVASARMAPLRSWCCHRMLALAWATFRCVNDGPEEPTRRPYPIEVEVL